MTEIELLRRIRWKTPLPKGSLILGIGDDAAIYRPKNSPEDLLFTTDLMVEGVHFLRSHPLEYVGYKALARGLSDIAAMGGTPRFALVSLAMPEARKAIGFYRGFMKLAKRTGTMLAGGDIARSKRFTIDVVVCGAVPRGKALRRDGAKFGDFLYVSGPLGRAASRRYRDLPEPRLSLGKKLRGKATSCMDLSDGLSSDLVRLCHESDVSSRVDYLPLFKGATEEQALNGGEDYELLYTAPPHVDVPGYRIGRIVEGWGETIVKGRVVGSGGYDHFVR